jgi:ADP-heptose:LPS heptosyltransferase
LENSLKQINKQQQQQQKKQEGKKRKYLGINLTKEKNNFYNENYKTLMKEIEENTQKSRKTCSGIRINIVTSTTQSSL